MSQLSQLIAQAKNRRGINDLFKTKVDALSFQPDITNGKKDNLDSQLSELESLIFKQSTATSNEIIHSLEEVLEAL